jgi:hypothetical protein
MDYRQGVCTGCQNSFRVPATFVQNKAKCPKCGGVVEIGPVQSGGASAAPAAAAAAAPAAAAATTSSAPAAAPKPAAAPAPVPARTPAPAKPAASAPASAVPAKPVAKPAAAAAPVAKPAAAPAKPAATPAAPKAVAPAAAKPAAPAGPSVRATAEAAAVKVKSGAGAKPKGRSKDEDEDEGSGKRRRAGAAPKKKSMAPMVLSAVIFLALVGVAGWYFGVKVPADEAQAAQAAKAAEDAKRAALLGTGSSVAAAEKTGESTPDATADATAAASEPAKAEAKPEETKPAETQAAEAKPVKEKAPVVDDVNLLDLPELGKYSKSSDEEWAEIVALVDTFATSGGAPSTRALRKLEELGRPAMPALLNVMRKLNLSDPEDFSRGDLIQRALEKICGGKNWGWKYDKDLETVVYNKKAIKSWFKTWDTAGEDDEQWAGLTKKAAPKEDTEKKPEAGGLDDF